MNTSKQLLKVALKARKVAERYQKANASEFSSDLCGLCGVASKVLVDLLKDAGFAPRLVVGRFQGDSNFGSKGAQRVNHSWVEVQGFVVDVTATQFGIKTPVLITPSKAPRSQYNAHFKGSDAQRNLKLWPKLQNPLAASTKKVLSTLL